MRELVALQRAIYDALMDAAGGRRCFVRLCATHDAMWVTDFPRAQREEAAALAALERLGVVCVNPQNKLWKLDLRLEAFAALLDGLPTAPPPLPSRDALHPAYALCRLWLAHPAPLELQPLNPLRAVLKLGLQPAVIRGLPELHQREAERLRQRQPIAHAAGRVLAAWLNEQEQLACDSNGALEMD